MDQLGAEEVVLVDEEESGKLLQFTTDPGDLAVVQQGMVGIGYKIEEVYIYMLKISSERLFNWDNIVVQFILSLGKSGLHSYNNYTALAHWS